MADHHGDKCDPGHPSLACRQTQMGMLGVLDLVASSSAAPRPLRRRVAQPPIRRFAISPHSPPPSSHSSSSSPSPDGGALSVSSSASSFDGSADHGDVADDLASLDDDSHSAYSSVNADEHPEPVAAVPGRRPRRTVGRTRTESEAERQMVLTDLISAALRRMLGQRTRADASVGSSMMAKVMGSSDARSRFLFCVVGPNAVDLATLWFSPDDLPLCSCWGHSQNVALLSMAGDSSSCWHAKAFAAAVDGMADSRREILTALQVREDTKPYAIDITTHKGMAAAAFDGTIYSPVVATRRRDVKCVAVSCRSNPRRCHHAELVKEIERLVVADDGAPDASDMSSDDDQRGKENDNYDEDGDGGLEDDDLVKIAKERQKRNLVSCEEEDKQGLKWARTAEWAADERATAPFWPVPPAVGGDAVVEPRASMTVLQRMAELGLVWDPAVVLHEKSCSQCGAAKTDEHQLSEKPGKLYCDGNGSEPLSVRLSLLAVWLCMHRFPVSCFGSCVPAFVVALVLCMS